MTLLRVAAVVPLIVHVACATHYDRGTLAAVSTKAVNLSMTVVQENVKGEYCWFLDYDRGYSRAVEDALRRVPEANALANATYTLKANCIVVKGTAIHVD